MGSHGITDRVAIVGMGCTPFAEHWDKGVDDLLVDACGEAFSSAGIDKQTVDAYWLGTAQSGMSGITLARALQLEGKPVTRVENYCATGSEALRQAAYAVASGAYDIAMAAGVEKVKDSGYQGLNAFPIPNDGTTRTLTAAGSFSMVAPAYAHRYGVDMVDLKHALARIASKNHANGARNPRAQFRREMSVEQLCAMPPVAGDLSVFDCAGVADGSAAAIVVRAEDAHRFTDRPISIKALSFVAGNGSGLIDPDYDYTTFPEIVTCAADAYRQAGITDPAPADRDGGGARLLHADGARADGGPRLLRTGHGVEGHRERDVRPRRRPPDQPGRWTQELRPSGRSHGAADDVRGVVATAGRRAGRPAHLDPDRGAQPGAHPQPRWVPGRNGQFRIHPRPDRGLRVSATVAALWRYPVKSLQGVETNTLTLGPRGVQGDRRYALVDSLTTMNSLHDNHLGVHCSVVEPGLIRAGDPVDLLD